MKHAQKYMTEQLPDGRVRHYDIEHPHDIQYWIDGDESIHNFYARTREEAVKYAKEFITRVKPRIAIVSLLTPSGTERWSRTLTYRDGVFSND